MEQMKPAERVEPLFISELLLLSQLPGSAVARPAQESITWAKNETRKSAFRTRTDGQTCTYT